MSHFRTFQSSRENTTSSDFINRKKCKTIYKDIKNKTNKVSCKTQSNIYVNPITKCLSGASNYDDLLNVTKGHFYYKYPTAKHLDLSNIWSGQYLYFNTDGLCMIKSQPDGICNQFRYPSVQDNTTNHYPRVGNNNTNASTENINVDINGEQIDITNFDNHSKIIVDPSYNVFYSDSSTYGIAGTCNNYAQLGYRKHVKLNTNNENKYLFVQDQKISNEIGGFKYPSKFKFTCDNEAIQNALTIVNNKESQPEPETEAEAEQETEPEPEPEPTPA